MSSDSQVGNSEKGVSGYRKVWKMAGFIQVLGIFMTNISWQQLYIRGFFSLCIWEHFSQSAIRKCSQELF